MKIRPNDIYVIENEQQTAIGKSKFTIENHIASFPVYSVIDNPQSSWRLDSHYGQKKKNSKKKKKKKKKQRIKDHMKEMAKSRDKFTQGWTNATMAKEL